MMSDKSALVRTAVGRRLIAFYTLFNSGKFERLREFLAENLTAEALAEIPVEERLNQIQADYSQSGRLRVRQVMATDDHHVVLLVQAERDDFIYYDEMRVTEDYPHKVMTYIHRPME